jgi:hypothetical protein
MMITVAVDPTRDGMICTIPNPDSAAHVAENFRSKQVTAVTMLLIYI